MDKSKRFDARTEYSKRKVSSKSLFLMLNNNSTEGSWAHNQERSPLLTQAQQYTGGQWRQNARTKLWTKVNEFVKLPLKYLFVNYNETYWFRDCLTVRLWALCKRDSFTLALSVCSSNLNLYWLSKWSKRYCDQWATGYHDPPTQCNLLGHQDLLTTICFFLMQEARESTDLRKILHHW